MLSSIFYIEACAPPSSLPLVCAAENKGRRPESEGRKGLLLAGKERGKVVNKTEEAMGIRTCRTDFWGPRISGEKD